MNLGISGQALGEVMDFSSIVDIAQKYGINHFELWPCNVPGNGSGYRDRDIETICRLKEKKNFVIDCVTLGAAFSRQDTESPKDYAELLMSAVDAAVATGAKLVNHYCYYINRAELPDFARMEAYWEIPLAYAKKRGITLVLENEAHDGTRKPELMAAIMEHFQDEAFATTFDVTNYYHASVEGFPAAYEILKPYIKYVHLKNGCLYRKGADQPAEHRGAPMSGLLEGTDIQYTPLPDGSVNIAGLLTALKEEGWYTGTCTLEPHTKPECVENFYRRETKWLKEHLFFE